MTEKEKEKFIDMLRENFGTDVSKIMNINKKETISNLIALLIGIFLMII